jgi:hypothetical protein
LYCAVGAENNKCGGARKSRKKHQTNDNGKKTKLFGHMCRMKNDRLIKQTIFGMMDGAGIRGRPAGRHRRLVRIGDPQIKQNGTGERQVETDGEPCD